MFVFLINLACSGVYVKHHEEKSFIAWMRKHKQFYTGHEYHVRFGVYLANSRFVESFNKGPKRNFHLSLNNLACMTPAEYRSINGLYQQFEGTKSTSNEPPKKFKKLSEIPKSIDYRDFGVVNPAQNQHFCGSCWAFAAICSCEGISALASGQLLKFSEQNLVDCICEGCGGGQRDVALDYVLDSQNGNFMLDDDYPYISKQNPSCMFDQSKAVGKINGYFKVDEGDEEGLLKAVGTYGPVSCGVNSFAGSFQHYSGGIYDDRENCRPTIITHAVCVIGYGTSEEGIDYYIVKNSWGDEWGELGFGRMIRGNNICGIANVSYPVF
ncbi:Cathepsin K [Tritrichomonas foetus]|uniref:Cathepsin K n=1 Tax=Tritrichomonas foetus TaxID=1144522 RepID=A0A1J4K2N5_9EUKA|nr:Cathepsin K [Tritrichomonas foetus]OHT05697.1 Cathepsin K [Tritrichomonas foetus]|eukprot:OHT05695.1 Cathepsin K [Tritrichomonas foetus]